MRVLLPSSTLPQVMNRSRLLYWWERRYASMSVAIRSDACAMVRAFVRRVVDVCSGRSERGSEVALLLFLLHGPGTVVVDDATLTLGGGGQEHLLHDLEQRRSVALDRPRQRVAAERAEAHVLDHRLLTGVEALTHAVVVD